MSNERLTRQELSWLLAQEARGAAKALREGVVQLTQPGPSIEVKQSLPPVEMTLDALDGAIDMLSELQTTTTQSAGRRGRIDLAALLCQVAPSARIAMEPGSGTEVFGEEGDLRRMLHVLVNQSHSPDISSGGSGAEVHIRRVDDWVKISVELGPDSSSTAELERRWLSRMAIRMGGRLDLESGTQALLLPADGATDQREVAELRRELEQAQQLGEAYARELAAVFSAGDLPAERSSFHGAEVGAERFELMQSIASGLGRQLRGLFEGLRADAGAASEALGDEAPLTQNLHRRASALAELVGEFDRIGMGNEDENPSNVDISALAREVIGEAGARAARHGVKLDIETQDISLRTRAPAFRLMLRALIDHAIAATPRGGSVRVVLKRAGELGVPVLSVADGGPVVPDAARSDVLRHRVDPSAFGRPAGVSLLIGDTVAGQLGFALSIAADDGGKSVVLALLSS